MKNSISTIVCAIALGVLTSGCDSADSAGAEPQALAFRPGDGGSGGGGVFLNTNAIGTNAFSEFDLTGAVHQGVRLDAVRIKQGGVFVTLDSVSSSDGELVGLIGATAYDGADFLDSEWDLTFVAGQTETPATMFVDAYSTTHGHKYTFKYTDSQAVEQYVCDPDPDGDFGAVALADISVHPVTGDVTSRDDTLYLGCTSGAVGKATTWGYHPWDLTAADFETAIRVVRADYCGNGASWTVPGTVIQLTDVWDINIFATPASDTEAIWGVDGAICVSTPRLAQHIGNVTCGGNPVPTCSGTATIPNTPDSQFWTKIVD